jgi:hypothetical protein
VKNLWNQCENEFVWGNDNKYRRDQSEVKCSDQRFVMVWDEQSESLCWDETIIVEEVQTKRDGMKDFRVSSHLLQFEELIFLFLRIEYSDCLTVERSKYQH